jgi:hypothetical protein
MQAQPSCAQALQEFQNAVYGDNYQQREAEAAASAEAALVARCAAKDEKKRKRETELLEKQRLYAETDWDTVMSGNPNVATLRLYLACNGLVAAGQRKDILMQQVTQHIAAHRL